MRLRAERVRYFSHGMQQHLAIARAILHSPRVLLLDEPHSGLDKNTAAQLDVLLQAEAAGGRSVVLVTHDVRSAWLAPARAAACTPESLLELCALDRACGLGRCVNPGLGVRPDSGVVILCCRNGTCGAAWIGVNQALAWCGEWCGLPIPDCRQCAFFACYAGQISATTKQTRSLT